MRRFLALPSGNLRSPWLWTLAAACLLAAGVCGFVSFFPAEILRPRLEQAAARHGLRLTVGALDTAFPPALVAKDVTLGAPAGKLPDVTIDRLRLRPAWLKLLTGTVAVKLDGELLGGELSGEVTRTGQFDLHATGLAWRGPLPGLTDATLAARLRQAAVAGAYPPAQDKEQRLELTLEEVTVERLLGAKTPLALGMVTLRARGKGNSLRFETLEATGGQLVASGEGSLLLVEALGRSPLNLSLNLRPAAGLDPLFAELLTALAPPGADGASRLRLGGTLLAPQKQ